MSIEHTYEIAGETITKTITKAKAIRAHCMDCCSGYQGEVAKCTSHTCALYPFRFGNEKGLERMYTEEESSHEEDDETIEEPSSDETKKEKSKKKLKRKVRKIKK